MNNCKEASRGRESGEEVFDIGATAAWITRVKYSAREARDRRVSRIDHWSDSRKKRIVTL